MIKGLICICLTLKGLSLSIKFVETTDVRHYSVNSPVIHLNEKKTVIFENKKRLIDYLCKKRMYNKPAIFNNNATIQCINGYDRSCLTIFNVQKPVYCVYVYFFLLILLFGNERK